MKVVEGDINVWGTKIVILKSFSNILSTFKKKVRPETKWGEIYKDDEEVKI